jgi:hypothetical protein
VCQQYFHKAKEKVSIKAAEEVFVRKFGCMESFDFIGLSIIHLIPPSRQDIDACRKRVPHQPELFRRRASMPAAILKNAQSRQRLRAFFRIYLVNSKHGH